MKKPVMWSGYANLVWTPIGEIIDWPSSLDSPTAQTGEGLEDLTDFFEDAMKAEWALLGRGNSLPSIAKKFYTLPEDTIEDLKVPLVDAPVVALQSGAVLLKDEENALNDSVDKKNKMALK
ncbi:UNVERIFIED_CONTAM: hypothetical protein K2H54_053345 [Gekko kuhli]